MFYNFFYYHIWKIKNSEKTYYQKNTDVILNSAKDYKTWYIKLPQMNAYTKYFDKNDKYMNHLVKDEKTLKKI